MWRVTQSKRLISLIWNTKRITETKPTADPGGLSSEPSEARIESPPLGRRGDGAVRSASTLPDPPWVSFRTALIRPFRPRIFWLETTQTHCDPIHTTSHFYPKVWMWMYACTTNIIPIYFMKMFARFRSKRHIAVPNVLCWYCVYYSVETFIR